MTRHALRALAGALVAGAALSPAVASAHTPAAAPEQAQAPSLRIHAIFTGGRSSHFHAGEVLFVDVRDAGGRKLGQVCWSPAPIGRPDCGAGHVGAPSRAGTTTVTATLDDGTELTRSLRVYRPATKVGGPRAVPATITCRDVTLFGNYDRRRHRSLDPLATVTRGAPVGLYNRIAPGKIFMWDYAGNRGGFASERCAAPQH